MDQEALLSNDVDLEEGELSDCSDTGVGNGIDDIYTLLAIPPNLTRSTVVNQSSIGGGVALTESTVDNSGRIGNNDDESNVESSESSSGESTDTCIGEMSRDAGFRAKQKKKRQRRPMMVRVQPADEASEKQRARFKRYNIWADTLQEEALAENMRGIEVDGSGRNVEKYDFMLRYRLGQRDALKRCFSNSAEDTALEDEHLQEKRRYLGETRRMGGYRGAEGLQRKSAKMRFGQPRHRVRGKYTGSDTEKMLKPRAIVDLEETRGRQPNDVALEIARKLHEEKSDLMVRIVEVLGIDIPMDVYKETQRIEADGGMLVIGGHRRRTPGGTFLFLLKRDDRVSPEKHKLIFDVDRQCANKDYKHMKALSRERKVEELKKRLSRQGDLPALLARKDLLVNNSEEYSEQIASDLSNPPPSPVDQEHHSPEYKTRAINHVEVGDGQEQPSTSTSARIALPSPTTDDDDFLDLNCMEIELF